MRTRHYIIAMMSVVTLTANAQNHTPNSANNGAIQSQQMMNSGANYNGAVYEPFSNTTPSEQSGSRLLPCQGSEWTEKNGRL